MTVLSCPFCGGRAKVYVAPDLPAEMWGVACRSCPARLMGYTTEAAAVAGWGGRVPHELAGEAVRRLIAACEAVLLYHRGRWSVEDRQRWHHLTGHFDATTKVLCRAVRVALGLVEHVRAGGDDTVASFWALWQDEERRA